MDSPSTDRYGRSLDDLEGSRTEAGPFSSGDTAWLHRIRRVPLWALDDDDLAFLLARGRGGEPVLSLALRRLADDPMRRTTVPPGRLLTVVAAVDSALWALAPACWTEMRRVVGLARSAATDGTEHEELALAAERFSVMLDSERGTPP